MPDWLSVQNLSANTPPKIGRSLTGQPHPSPLSQRLSIGPRSSSLTGSPNNSPNASLSGTNRLQKGSSLKFELNEEPAEGVEDPLDVVRRIIGNVARQSTSSSPDDGTEDMLERPTELISDINFGGLSLEEFAGISQAKELDKASDVNTTSKAISPVLQVKDYVEEKEKYEDLHRSILACDEVLKAVESYLGNFQADLASVSAEIETLQTRSASLNTKLENRKVVESYLGPAVEELSVPPAIVKKITQGLIDSDFETALDEIDKRTKSSAAKSNGAPIKAYADVQVLLENLQYKAIECIRDYFISQIKALRSPGINAQIIQQQAFVQYKGLYEYLARHQRQLADDILQAYINTVRWHYQYSFVQYEASLRKMKLYALSKSDLLGADDASGSNKKPGQHSRNNSNANVGMRSLRDSFSLGERIDLIIRPPAKVLTAYEAEENQYTNNIEVPFHAFTQALIDNASWEYSVLTGLLSSLPGGIVAASRAFASIFEPIFTIGQSFTRHLVDETYDTLGILFCIRLTQRAAFTLQRRRVPVVENYINATTMLLWPRLQQVMDAHCESMRLIAAANPSTSNSQQQQQQQQQHLSPNKSLQPKQQRPTLASSASSFLSLSTSPFTSSFTSPSTSTNAAAAQAAGMTNSTAPHPLTQRFARFTASILTLSSPTANPGAVDPAMAALGAEEPVMRSLARLRTEFEACLFRLGHFLLVASDVSNASSTSNSNSNNNRGHGRRKSSSGGGGSGGSGSSSKTGSASMKQCTVNRTRRRDRFLENNYALVGTVLEGVEGRMAEEVRGYFEGLRAGLAGDTLEE